MILKQRYKDIDISNIIYMYEFICIYLRLYDLFRISINRILLTRYKDSWGYVAGKNIDIFNKDF